MVTKRIAGVVMVMMVVLGVVVLSPPSGQAADKQAVQWEIKTYDDHTIKETVTINNNEIELDSSGWEKIVNGDTTVLSRTVNDWPAYNVLTDKLPIKAQTRNFFLWHKTSLLVTVDEAPAGSVFSQLRDLPGINIMVSIPGYISASSGDRLSEMSILWKLDKVEDLTEGEVMLQAITFEGFLIGMIAFLLGLIIIAIVYMRRMKKIEQLMAAEYSLENIELEQLRDKDQGDDDEKSNWF